MCERERERKRERGTTKTTMGNCIPKQDWGTPTGDGFTDISAAPRTNSKVDAPPSNPNEALSYAEHVIGDLLKGDVNADEQREALQQVAVALRRATADAKKSLARKGCQRHDEREVIITP